MPWIIVDHVSNICQVWQSHPCINVWDVPMYYLSSYPTPPNCVESKQLPDHQKILNLSIPDLVCGCKRSLTIQTSFTTQASSLPWPHSLLINVSSSSSWSCFSSCSYCSLARQSTPNLDQARTNPSPAWLSTGLSKISVHFMGFCFEIKVRKLRLTLV